MVLGGSNCNEEQSTQELIDLDNDGRVIGVISGIVLDDATQEPIVGAQVYFQRAGAITAVSTNSVGYYAITDMVQGTYELEVIPPKDSETDAAVHAGVAVRVTVPTLEEIGVHDVPTDEPFHHAVDREIRVYPLTASANGVVFVSDEAQVVGVDPLTGSPANGATVLLDADPMDPDVRVLFDQASATTDASGSYGFTGFPATPGAMVSVLTHTDSGRTYAESTVNVGLANTGTTVVPDVFLYNAAGPPVITANNFIGSGDFSVSEDLTLSFNKEFDTDTVDLDLHRVAGGGVVETLTIDVSISSGTVFIIEPSVQLKLGSDYRLDFDGWTDDGVQFVRSFNFSTEDSIKLFSSNIQQTDGSEVVNFVTTDDISLSFTREVDATHSDTLFTLREDGFEVYAAVVVAGDSVTLSPQYSLEPGTPYSLDYTAHSPIDGDSSSGSIDFETDAGLSVPGAVTGFSLDPVDLEVDYNTRTLRVQWDNVDGADGYRIWARDDLHNTSLVLVDEEEHSDHLAWQSSAFLLPDQFDAFSGDTNTTPFVDTIVSLSIEAYNDAGAGPLLTPEVLVVDNVAPMNASVLGQDSSANNSGNFAPIEVRVAFSTGEYVDTASGSVIVPASPASTVEWDSDALGGVIVVPVNPGANLSGSTLDFSFTDARGNPGTLPTHTLN